MSSESGSTTSTKLLRRLREQPIDQAAWAEFVARYGKKIYSWCRRWNLQDADAADVTQAVLLKLAQVMRNFVYNPSGSFCGWLRTLTHHAWRDLVKRRRQFTVRGSGTQEGLQTVEMRCNFANPDAALDREVFEYAMDRVRQRVHRRTWDVFHLTALDGLSGPEAATRLGVPLATVYKAKSNVQKLLQEEIRRLEGAPAK